MKKVCLGCKKVFYKTKNLRGIKWYGKKYCTHKCFLKYRKTNKGMKFAYKARPNQKRLLNENNPAWKGNEAGYRALHIWVEQRLGKAVHCELNDSHLSGRYHWANISRNYHRNINDWIQLCPKCHFLYDRKGIL